MSSVQSVSHIVQRSATGLLSMDPPTGFYAATANVVASAPTIAEIRRGSFGSEGWKADEQREQRKRTLSSSSSNKRRSGRISEGDREREVDAGLQAFPELTEEPSEIDAQHGKAVGGPSYRLEQVETPIETQDTNDTYMRTGHERIKPVSGDRRVYSSGYIPPPVIPWTTSTAIALKGFGKWVCTPFGFLLTLYGLNVVAWGGMLFLLLCNASPPMCWAPVPSAATEGRMGLIAALRLNDGRYPRYHNCNDINSPRRVWLEIDSQILNALFCVTGFGLIPWRFRDWWYLLLWRCTSEKRAGREKKVYGLRVLAGIYRNWVRLPDSQTLDQLSSAEYQRRQLKQSQTTDSPTSGSLDLEEAANTSSTDLRLPVPASKIPDDPLTGVRAPPTAPWKIDFFVWSQVLNTFLQACLCGFMWGMNRYDRPSWSTGLFIALACIIAGLGGLVSFLEGKKVKRVEGVRAAHMPEGKGEAGVVMERTGMGRE
ncbi:hypothetical protein LTR53_004433 [Teratosphaeriaceae sp. CCFEE 6253]|nr:hypothetical protein LTR53_004433 [Teratosphaeriaceae sp. CCFEE 6253]